MPYPQAFNTKNALTSLLREVNYSALEKLPLATVITGEAKFITPTDVQIKLKTNGEVVQIKANRIFINTGSQPFLPTINGLDRSRRSFTSISLLNQSVLLRKIAIIGGGFIGLEFADMYAKFGAEVTILESNETFLPKEDIDVAAEMYSLLTEKNIQILTGVTVERVEDVEDDQVKVYYQDNKGEVQSLTVSAILLATGRMPTSGELNLEAAGVHTNKRGYIEVDEFLKTSAPSIWAIGDCNGGPQFTYISLDDFRIIKGQLSDGKYTSVKQRKEIASTVFTTPPFAHIGLRENDAKAQGLDYKVAKLPVTNIPRARIDGNTNGFLKTLVNVKTHKIIGCTLICSEAHEMINTIQVAMNAGVDYQVIRDTVFTHPSMTESFNDLFSLI